MTARLLVLAVLARMLPSRGRHRYRPGSDDTAVLPRLPGWDGEGPSVSDLTELDVPPAHDRPYVQPGDGGETGRWLP